MRVLITLCVVFQLIVSNLLYGQQATVADSLAQIAKTQKGDSLINTLNELSWQYRNSNQDSAIFYARRALKISISESYNKGIARSYNSIASVFQANGQLDSAVVYHKKSLEIKLLEKDSIGIADTYNNLGIVYDEKGNYEISLTHYFKALRVYENNKADYSKVAMVYGNVGIVYKKLDEYQKTLDYYQQALALYKSNNNEVGEVITTSNIGSLQLQLKNFESAIEYTSKAKEDYERLGYVRYVPYVLFNRAIALDSLKRHREAAVDYENAIEQFSKDANLYELSSAKIGYAQNLLFRDKANNALQSVTEALDIAKENGFKEFEVKGYLFKAKALSNLGRYSEAYTYQQLFQIENDSLFEAKKVESILELETKYETEKKEKEILSQRAEIVEKENEVTQKNNLLYGSLGLTVILGLLGYLFYNQQRLKNSQLKKEGELKEALARIETQNKLQEQRLRISRDLHDNIGAQLTFIISSLDNLKFGFPEMKEKLATKLGSISQFTGQTIYELRDTIWAMNKEEISFEDLQVRIANFVEKAKGVSNASVAFKVDETISKDVSLSSVVGMNVYRIIQEGVNNAIKYANASNIDVHISEEKENYQVMVKDDGTGYDASSVEMGNGLNNMKKRTRDIKGEILFISEIEQGTTIDLQFPK